MNQWSKEIDGHRLPRWQESSAHWIQTCHWTWQSQKLIHYCFNLFKFLPLRIQQALSEDTNVCFPQPRNKLGGQDKKTTHQILTGPFAPGSESPRNKVFPSLFLNPQHPGLRGASSSLMEGRLMPFTQLPPRVKWRPKFRPKTLHWEFLLFTFSSLKKEINKVAQQAALAITSSIWMSTVHQTE